MAGMMQAPFALPADSVETVIDLPMPPSTNRLWRSGRGRVYKSKQYLDWMDAADAHVMASRQFPKRKITGPFTIHIALNTLEGGDGDNRIKAPLDWLQSRDIVRNDSDCVKGAWEWVEPARAPQGVRVTLRSW